MLCLWLLLTGQNVYFKGICYKELGAAQNVSRKWSPARKRTSFLTSYTCTHNNPTCWLISALPKEMSLQSGGPESHVSPQEKFKSEHGVLWRKCWYSCSTVQHYEWGVDKCWEQPSYWNYSANQACAQVTAFYEHMFPDLMTNRKVAHVDLWSLLQSHCWAIIWVAGGRIMFNSASWSCIWNAINWLLLVVN